MRNLAVAPKKTLAVVFTILAILAGLLLALLAMGLAVPEGSPTVVAPGEVGSGLDLPLVTLDGNWASHPEQSGSKFVATVNNDKITMHMSNGKVDMTYWNGTFQSSATPGDSILSNKLEIDHVVLSGADNKTFYVGNNTLTFEFTAMGSTRSVTLNRA